MDGGREMTSWKEKMPRLGIGKYWNDHTDTLTRAFDFDV
jgi:hypothetical protein